MGAKRSCFVLASALLLLLSIRGTAEAFSEVKELPVSEM